MKGFTRFRYISYLDLVCCSFGGALLLFLIALSSSSVGTRRDPTKEMIIVCAAHKAGPKAEVAILFKGPDDKDFRLPENEPDMRYFSARSGPNSGGESFLILMHPRSGEWRFRVGQKNFPLGADVSGGLSDLEVIGDGVERLEDVIVGKEGPLRGPGDISGRVLRVWIHPR